MKYSEESLGRQVDNISVRVSVLASVFRVERFVMFVRKNFGRQSTKNLRRRDNMKYIVSITFNNHTEYIAEGRNYTVNGSTYVPFTERMGEAKRYKTRNLAERASERSGENMYGSVNIVEVEE